MSTFRGQANSRYSLPPTPPAAIRLTVGPQLRRSAREAEYTLTLGNDSDVAETLALVVDAPALGMQYTFQPQMLRLAAHAQGTARLLMRAWGTPAKETQHFVISVLRAGDHSPVAQSEASFVPDAPKVTAFRRPDALVPILTAVGLLVLLCGLGTIGLLAWQLLGSRPAGVVAHASTPSADGPASGGAAGSAATSAPASPTALPASSTSVPAAPTSTPVTSASTPVPPANTPIPTRTAAPVSANPDAALVSYYAHINARAYSVTWVALSPRYQSEANENNFEAYQAFWNSVARVTIVNTKVLSQLDSSATVQTTLRYAYNNGHVVDETTTFRLLWNGAQRQWLIDAVVH